jgi:arginine/lysine/ornithine decarboxylase
VAHERDVPLYVDEAWGPHFHFHQALPKSALESGADADVGSVHKLLPAVSQGSVLHVNSELLDVERIETAVRMMQTTSPLLPILATIDGARRQMALSGKTMLGEAIALANQVRERVSAIDGIEIVDAATLEIPEPSFDQLKLVIDVRGLGFSGFEVERILNDTFEIAIELSDFRGVIGTLNCGDTQASIDRLVHALIEISKSDRLVSLQATSQTRSSGSAIGITTQVMSPRDAYFARSESIDLLFA